MHTAYSPYTLTIVGLIWLAASARITRLVTEDSITQFVRDWINNKAALRISDDDTRADLAPWPWRKLAQIVSCHWCASVYVGLVASTTYLTWATGTPSFVIDDGRFTFGWDAATWAVWLPAALASSWAVATAADWLDSPPPHRHHTVRLTRDSDGEL